MNRPNENLLSQQINQALVNYEVWAETQPKASVEKFAEEMNLGVTLAAHLKSALDLESNVINLLHDNSSEPELENYRMERRLGVGGMGIVWLAKQTKPVERSVAIKFLRAELNRPEMLTRFEMERQAHSILQHPHIATMLDAGTLDAHQPYFVMEYVDGLPLTEYCDQNRLGIRRRLELFQQLCSAIQYAHQNGVIHRDIKPANVLVSEDQGVPMVKVIDFGISKFSAPEDFDLDLEATDVNLFFGSPLWMSPERIETVRSRQVDTRSDVYSLGIVLYQLLTGSTPTSEETLLDKSKREIIEHLQNFRPEVPSAKLQSQSEWLQSSANSSGEWAPQLKNDLDWIAMKALARDPDKRFQTVQELSRDISRYLENDPVESRPSTLGYRLRKSIAKNRTRTLAAIVVAITLLIASVISAVLASWALREKRVAVAQRTKAETANQKLNETNTKLEKTNTELEKTKLGLQSSLAENRKHVKNYFDLVNQQLELFDGIDIKNAEIRFNEHLRITLARIAKNLLQSDYPQSEKTPTLVGGVFAAGIFRPDRFGSRTRRFGNFHSPKCEG